MWPLMHGTLATTFDVEAIRIGGLIGSRQEKEAINSSLFWEFEEALGRTNHVFLAPLTFQGNYGIGTFILVDPLVLRKDNVWFADQDIKGAVECVNIKIEGGSPICWKINAPDSLKEVIATQHANKHGRSTEEMAMPIVCSTAFKAYYRQFYQLDEESFFRSIEMTAKAEEYTLAEYFNRTRIWPLEEEILIPGKVEPQYLLGYWDGANWTDWACARTSETQHTVRNNSSTHLNNLGDRSGEGNGDLF